MLVGFIHGVMNTDNMTISGETIDYGPCAFMDAFDPATVFSSIDHGGRYAYGNQPQIAQWNLARLGRDAAAAVRRRHGGGRCRRPPRCCSRSPTATRATGRDGMRAKLGLGGRQRGDEELIDDLLALLHAQQVDFTSCFRALSSSVRGDDGTGPIALRRTRPPSTRGRPVGGRSCRRQAGDPTGDRARDGPGQPRLHPAQPPGRRSLAAATDGDLGPFRRLLDVLAQPFDERPGLEAYAAPAPPSFGPYRTFCGT